MNLQHERIAMMCERLRLGSMAREWPALAQQAAGSEASYADFLEQLLNAENEARIERQREALMKIATLPGIKTIEQYDFGFASGAPRSQIQELASLTFIARAAVPLFLLMVVAVALITLFPELVTFLPQQMIVRR